MELHTILTAADPSAAELQVLRAGAQLAAAARARLLVLSVTDNPWKLLGPEEETYADRTPSRGELVALAAERLAQRLGPLLLPSGRLRWRITWASECPQWKLLAGPKPRGPISSSSDGSPAGA